MVIRFSFTNSQSVDGSGNRMVGFFVRSGSDPAGRL